jgi:hypothetical protein
LAAKGGSYCRAGYFSFSGRSGISAAMPPRDTLQAIPASNSLRPVIEKRCFIE